ncbi:VOC family protein [Imbroritus primus]
MMQVNPYLNFNGNCKEAFAFYAKVLKTDIVMMLPFSGTPMADQAPPEMRDLIAHAQLRIGDCVLMASDAPSHYEQPKGMNVTLGIEAPEEAERVFNALAEGGTVQMPLAETFWAQRFGMVVDRFGIPWMINCEKPREQWAP